MHVRKTVLTTEIQSITNHTQDHTFTSSIILKATSKLVDDNLGSVSYADGDLVNVDKERTSISCGS